MPVQCWNFHNNWNFDWKDKKLSNPLNNEKRNEKLYKQSGYYKMTVLTLWTWFSNAESTYHRGIIKIMLTLFKLHVQVVSMWLQSPLPCLW